MGAMASQINSLPIVNSTVYSGVYQRKHQSFALLAFVTGEFPAQRASNAENIFIGWRHRVCNSMGVRASVDRINGCPLSCKDLATDGDSGPGC